MGKAIPTDHRPAVRSLEVHITYRCNLRCLHCSNLIEQAPSNETMPPATVAALLADSVRLDYRWERIVLHGGEPTLHPDLDEICEMLAAYKRDHNPACGIYICTNGHGEKVAAGIEVARRHGVGIENSMKGGGQDVYYHHALSSSPADLGEDYNLGCFQTSKCGIAYTMRGFYECSPAASAWRLFGYAPMATRLEDVTEERLAAGFAEHCKHCGYSRINSGANVNAPYSETWKAAIDAYKNRKR